MAIDVRELRAQPLDPEIEEELSQLRRRRPPLHRRRDRRRRLPGVPPQPGHLRPAPGRLQPDGAGEDPLRAGRARPARDARLPRGDLLARLGPPHHPPERAVPLRAARDRPARCCACSRRSGSPAARRAATPCATWPAATSPARAPTRCSTSARGPRPPRTSSCATRSSQRLPRKFKINFSGCATDCGQAMFNDVGVIAVNRPLPDGTVEPGFRVFMAGGLGANPHPAQALEEFTSREDLLPTIEAILRVAGPLRQPRQQAARPPEVARRHDGRSTSCASASSRSASSSPRRPRTRAASPTSSSATATRPRAWARR